MRIGRAPNDRKIDVYQNILMNSNNITDLSDPLSAQDAATKIYVDKSLKKCRVGYIPPLEADVSVTGFVASASSCFSENKAYHAFTNLTDDVNAAWVSGEDETVWLQIKCPEPVKIWRIALNTEWVFGMWSLSASIDGVVFTHLLTSWSRSEAVLGVLTFLNISTTDAYQYYRVTSIAWQREDNRIRKIQVGLMQLYVYDD